MIAVLTPTCTEEECGVDLVHCPGVLDCFHTQRPLIGTGRWFYIFLQGIALGLTIDIFFCNFYVWIASVFTKWEKWRTVEEHQTALIRKSFAFLWFSFFVWFLTLAFLYVPYGGQVQEFFRTVSIIVGFKEGTGPYERWIEGAIEMDRAFVTPLLVTQGLNLLLETFVPYLLRKVQNKARQQALVVNRKMQLLYDHGHKVAQAVTTGLQYVQPAILRSSNSRSSMKDTQMRAGRIRSGNLVVEANDDVESIASTSVDQRTANPDNESQSDHSSAPRMARKGSASVLPENCASDSIDSVHPGRQFTMPIGVVPEEDENEVKESLTQMVKISPNTGKSPPNIPFVHGIKRDSLSQDQTQPNVIALAQLQGSFKLSAPQLAQPEGKPKIHRHKITQNYEQRMLATEASLIRRLKQLSSHYDTSLKIKHFVVQKDTHTTSKECIVTAEDILEESTLSVFHPFSDYLDMIIQFSYVSMFTVVWPFAPLCAFVNNFFEIRGDVFKLFFDCRRPVRRRTISIGYWMTILQLEIVIAATVVSGLIVVSTGQLDFFAGCKWVINYDKEGDVYGPVFDEACVLKTSSRWAIFVILEHLGLFVLFFIHDLVSNVSDHTEKQRAVQDAVIKAQMRAYLSFVGRRILVNIEPFVWWMATISWARHGDYKVKFQRPQKATSPFGSLECPKNLTKVDRNVALAIPESTNNSNLSQREGRQMYKQRSSVRVIKRLFTTSFAQGNGPLVEEEMEQVIDFNKEIWLEGRRYLDLAAIKHMPLYQRGNPVLVREDNVWFEAVVEEVRRSSYLLRYLRDGSTEARPHDDRNLYALPESACFTTLE